MDYTGSLYYLIPFRNSLEDSAKRKPCPMTNEFSILAMVRGWGPFPCASGFHHTSSHELHWCILRNILPSNGLDSEPSSIQPENGCFRLSSTREHSRRLFSSSFDMRRTSAHQQRYQHSHWEYVHMSIWYGQMPSYVSVDRKLERDARHLWAWFCSTGNCPSTTCCTAAASSGRRSSSDTSITTSRAAG